MRRGSQEEIGHFVNFVDIETSASPNERKERGRNINYLIN
jgi:hypothetical protein